MQAILYKNNSKKEEMNQTLTNEKTVDITIKHDSINQSEFDIEFSSVANITNYNYIRIPSYNRYYFLSEPTRLKGGIIQVHCSVDVLMSHAEFINNIYGILDKSTNNFNGYLLDTNYKMNTYKQIVQKALNTSNVFTDTVYLLTVGGGA